MITRILASITIVSVSILLFILHTTSPADAGPVGMLALFVLVYMSLLGVVTFLLFYGVKLIMLIVGIFTHRASRGGLSLTRSYLYSSVLALLPMMAIGLHSTGGIAWYEFILLLLFGVIGITYITKRS